MHSYERPLRDLAALQMIRRIYNRASDSLIAPQARALTYVLLTDYLSDGMFTSFYDRSSIAGSADRVGGHRARTLHRDMMSDDNYSATHGILSVYVASELA